MSKKKGMSDEQKQDAFDAWQQTEEWKAIERFIEKKETAPFEIASRDICYDMQPFLNELEAMMKTMKIPHKAKEYQQKFVRTMFFERLEKSNDVVIDGVVYPITNNANVENFTCRQALFELTNFFDQGRLEMECTPENLSTWKKDLQKAGKAWDAAYNKHIKAKIYDEMNAIHMSAMKPLNNAIAANLAFYRLERIIETDEKVEVPDFRYNALEEQFCATLTEICRLMAEFGNDRIEEPYDIRQQQKTLKIENWHKIIPFAFYLTPLKKSIDAVRQEMIDMHERGPLLVKYYVEENEQLHDLIRKMLQADQKAQLLMGDPLKQDQFKFFYDTCRIIYDSALRPKLCNDDQFLQQEVIPILVAFKAAIVIRDIKLKKKLEGIKEEEKKERLSKSPVRRRIMLEQQQMKEEEEKKASEDKAAEKSPKKGAAKGKKGVKDEGPSEEELAAIAAAEKERKLYGRMWIWEGLYNEKYKDVWLQTADMLAEVNPHVLQDMEDAILLKGFQSMKPLAIKAEIEKDQEQRIADEKKLRGTEGPEYEKHEQEMEAKRKILAQLRPSDKIWNFFEDCDEEDRVKHVMQYNAKPEASYCDGRIQSIMENIELLAANLKDFNEPVWTSLMRNTVVIFKAEMKEHQRRVANA